MFSDKPTELLVDLVVLVRLQLSHFSGLLRHDIPDASYDEITAPSPQGVILKEYICRPYLPSSTTINIVCYGISIIDADIDNGSALHLASALDTNSKNMREGKEHL